MKPKPVFTRTAGLKDVATARRALEMPKAIPCTLEAVSDRLGQAL